MAIRANLKRHTCWEVWMMGRSFMTHRKMDLVGHLRKMLTVLKKKTKCMCDLRTVSNIQIVKDYICHYTSTNKVQHVCQDELYIILILMRIGTSFPENSSTYAADPRTAFSVETNHL